MSVAFVFPGQGSQSLGMLRELSATSGRVSATFEEASAVLGYDLWKLVQEGPESELNLTERTQPAMLAAGVAVWRAWRERGGCIPSIMAGHSLGEYSALVCSGALDFADGIRLVAMRGRYMQDAIPAGEGGMAAVLGLELLALEKICADVAAGQTVTCANLNAPGQIVIAGHRDAVERAAAAAKAAGAKRAVLLPVSVPSHCALMLEAAERLRVDLQKMRWSKPAIPVLHNHDITQHDASSDIIEALVAQLHRPVRWIETIQEMRRRGVTRIVECGPGKVLAALCKRIDSSIECQAVFDPTTLNTTLASTGGQ